MQKPVIGKTESLSSAAELTGMNSETPDFPPPITQHLEGVSAFMRKEKKSLKFKWWCFEMHGSQLISVYRLHSACSDWRLLNQVSAKHLEVETRSSTRTTFK